MINDNYKKLPEIFDEIEIIAQTDIDRALKKMIDIYPQVVDSYYHDIADSINIWILKKGNKEIRKYILDKLPCVNDEYSKGILIEWINKLDNE